METVEVIYEKVYASPRLPPKISLKHDWMKELGSEVARQPEGEVARQAEGSQPTQPNPNPNHDRTGRLDDMQDGRNTSRSQEIDTRFSRDCKNSNSEESANHDRKERPVACSQNTSRTRFSRDCKNTNLNEDANHDRTERPVECSVRGHRLQNIWIATFSCETSRKFSCS